MPFLCTGSEEAMSVVVEYPLVSMIASFISGQIATLVLLVFCLAARRSGRP